MQLILDFSPEEYQQWLQQQEPNSIVGWENLAADYPLRRYLLTQFPAADEIEIDNDEQGMPSVFITFDSGKLPRFFPVMCFSWRLAPWAAQLSHFYFRQQSQLRLLPKLTAAQALEDFHQVLRSA